MTIRISHIVYGKMIPSTRVKLATLDTNIGRLVDALKAAGRYENTIIVLTGDNGG